MAEPWESAPIVEDTPSGGNPWESAPVVNPNAPSARTQAIADRTREQIAVGRQRIADLREQLRRNPGQARQIAAQARQITATMNNLTTQLRNLDAANQNVRRVRNRNPEPRNRSFGERFGDALRMGAEEGLVGYGVRRFADAINWGMPEDRRGLSEEQAEIAHDEAIRRVSQQRRRAYEEASAADPIRSVGDVGAELLGNVVGGADPTYLLGPGRTALQRILAQGAINAGVDLGTQGLEIGEGIRDEVDLQRAAFNAAAGAGFQGAGEAVRGVVRGVRGRRDAAARQNRVTGRAQAEAEDFGTFADGSSGEIRIGADSNAEAPRGPTFGNRAEPWNDAPIVEPRTSDASFDETAELMSRFDEEALPGESREQFVVRKTREETEIPITPEEAGRNVDEDISNFQNRGADRRQGTDRRAPPFEGRRDPFIDIPEGTSFRIVNDSLARLDGVNPEAASMFSIVDADNQLIGVGTIDINGPTRGQILTWDLRTGQPGVRVNLTPEQRGQLLQTLREERGFDLRDPSLERRTEARRSPNDRRLAGSDRRRPESDLGRDDTISFPDGTNQPVRTFSTDEIRQRLGDEPTPEQGQLINRTSPDDNSAFLEYETPGGDRVSISVTIDERGNGVINIRDAGKRLSPADLRHILRQVRDTFPHIRQVRGKVDSSPIQGRNTPTDESRQRIARGNPDDQRFEDLRTRYFDEGEDLTPEEWEWFMDQAAKRDFPLGGPVPPADTRAMITRQDDINRLIGDEARVTGEAPSADRGRLVNTSGPDDDFISLDYAAPDGKRVGLSLVIMGDGTARVNIMGPGPNKLGPKIMRDILRQVREMFPEVKKIAGNRVTGARTAKAKRGEDVNTSINLRQAERAGSDEPTIDPEGIYRTDPTGSGDAPPPSEPPRGGGGDEPPPPDGPDGDGPDMPEEPKRRGFAGNINLDRINGTKDLDDVLREAAEQGSTRADRYQSRAATEDLARNLGMTVEELLEHNPTLKEAPQYAVALRNLMKVAGDRFALLSREVANGNTSDRVLRDFALAHARLATIVERTMEVTGVAGRLLDSFNIRARGGTAYAKALSQLPPNDMWTPENARKLAEMFNRYVDNPGAQMRMLTDSLKPKAEDYLFSAWYNWGLLSGPTTHAVNITSTAANFLTDIAEHGLAAVLGQTRRWSKNADRVAGREVAARIYGAIRAVGQAIPNMREAFRYGSPLDQVNRIERPHIYKPGAVGYTMEFFTRSMAAQDEFFRTIATMSELYGQAVRSTLKETGKVDWRAVDRAVRSPDDEALKVASDYALRIRFQDKASALGRMVERLRTRGPDDNLAARGAKGLVRLLIPFVRTPDSLFRTAIRRSPLGFLDRYNQADWKAGGARRDLVHTRIAAGSALAMYAVIQAVNGNLTGSGPTDYARREQLQATGWRQNSIRREDGTYVSLDGYEPLSITLSGIATLTERAMAGEETEASYAEQALKAMLEFARVSNDNVWTENLVGALEAMNPQRGDSAVRNTIANVGSSMVVPAFMRQLNAQYVDPTVRDTRGDGSLEGRIEGRIRAGVPGLSEKLDPNYDVYGRTVQRGDRVGPDFLTRMNQSPTDTDPVVHEVERLSREVNGNRVLVGPPGITLKGQRLTPEQQQAYQRVSGQYIHEYLTELLNSPEWGEMSDEERLTEVKGVVRDMRAAAREELFPELYGEPEEEVIDDEDDAS